MVAAAAALRAWVLLPLSVEGEGMAPTLVPGEVVLVVRGVEPRLGDEIGQSEPKLYGMTHIANTLVWMTDLDAAAVDEVRALAARHAPHLAPTNFRVEAVEAMTFPDGHADVVLSSAVLHFARDERHFEAMLQGNWRVLASGGVFFCRLASSIGMEDRVRRIDGRRFRLPDGTERFLVDEPFLLDATARLGGELLDPLKTTVVQNQRCMTTWVVHRQNTPVPIPTR